MNTKPGNMYKLEDLIDIKHFQDLQDRLYKIYPFASAVIDNDGNILTATGWQDICTNFHRKNKECERACIQSDKYIAEHLDAANPAITYQCPHGLVDNAIPIIIDDIHYGNFFTGQFFIEKPEMKFFKKQAERFGFSEKLYLDAVKKVPICSKEQLESFLTFFKGLIDIVSEIGFKNLKELEAKKHIQESEEKYRQLFEGMRDAYGSIDMKGSIVDANKAFCEMMGYSLEELRKLAYEELTPEKWHTVEKEIFEKQVLLRGYSDIYEKEAIHKNGTVFPVELRTFLIKDKSGKAQGISAIARDISKRKKAEKDIGEREELLNKSQEMASIGSFVWDMITNKITWSRNMYKIYGYDEESFTGDLFEISNQLIHPDDDERANKEISETIEKTSAWDSEFRIIRPDGKERIIRSKGEVERDADGKQIRCYGINQDVTEKKEMESQLQHAKKIESIGTLAGGIAHDFNNILSPIMLHAEMAMAELPPDDPLQQCMKEIFTAGERARNLVKQILTVARKRSEKRTVLKLSFIINEAFNFLRSTIPATIDIQYNIRSEKDTVLADPTQLNQIIMNLCTNAAHAMREKGGLLEIILDNENLSSREAKRFFNLKQGKYVKLSIRDNGTGMSPDILGRIFEPYYTTKRAGEGTGLGLATVHGIVQNYGGDITVESTVGKGTAFHVYLPLVDAEIQVDPENRLEIQKGTESILLVDDEKAAVDITQKMLEKFGYKVTSTTSSREALEIFLGNPAAFDLVITDMTMPNMTGDELAKEILSSAPEMPVILCTGFSDNINEEKSKSLGIRCFILKPIIMNKLAKKIREVLDKRK